MAKYGLLLWILFSPTLVEYTELMAEEGGKKAHLEVGTVPQQGSQGSNTEYGYIKQRGSRAHRLLWNTVRYCSRSGGPQALSTVLSYIIQPRSGLD